MLDQTQVPLLDQLNRSAQRPHAPFYAPGHKRGQGISQRLKDSLGSQVFQADLPELPELDNLFAPDGVIQQAQELAAEAFGAEQTWFLVNGSTAGIVAAILATCGTANNPEHRPNQTKIIVPRNAHQSVISGLILSGATAIFTTPEYDSDWDMVGTVTPQTIAQGLQAHPDAKAVLIVSPTYQGICSDIAAIAKITHQSNIPLLVDEAHGAHFAFHPKLPTPALVAGADLTVQSTHKVLGAMTQSSMLHVQGDRIDRQRLSQALQLMQSTSPSYLLLASLDAARHQMATQGQYLLERTLQLAQQAKAGLQKISGIAVFEQSLSKHPDHGLPDLGLPYLGLPYLGLPGLDVKTVEGIGLDPTRLTVKVTGLGLSGYAADEILHEQLGVTAELPSLSHLTFMVSLGNTEQDIQHLVQGFEQLAQAYTQAPSTSEFFRFDFLIQSAFDPVFPRAAFFAKSEVRLVSQAIGWLSTECVCPYPPGIPILLPGERITSKAVNYLKQVMECGGTVTGCGDSTLKTLRVVAGSGS
ncbi:MAG: aminotransferase class I/II-fold pyridoxal phosphate-dependent enzyme [Microcoleaceae cyanobacterium]